MKATAPLLLIFALLPIPLAAQAATARAIADESAKKPLAQESVQFIKDNLPNVSDKAEKRSLLAFLGALQEQMALYDDARESYTAAAAIAAGDAPGMGAKTNERLVIDAARCALCSGDSAAADICLNSQVRSSKDESIQALINLYTQWSALVRARTSADLAEPVVMLKAYAALPSMASVRPSIYLTIWYVSGENFFAQALKDEFPSSIEAAIVTGKAKMLPAPFWYFLPRKSEAEAATAAAPVVESGAGEIGKEAGGASGVESSESVERPKKLQLGLFREKSNAQNLVSTLESKGFRPVIATEKRPSGATYYVVVIENPAKGVEENLRTAGFEFYPVF